MAQNYPGLISKGKTYYFRLGIPRKFWEIARCKEIGYSLNTSNYSEAIKKWRIELTHMQTFFDVFEEIVMKINPDNKLILDESDVDKVLLYRLEQIQHFLEENVVEIEEGKKAYKDIRLYSDSEKKKNPDKIRKLMVALIINYLKGLVDSNQANVTLKSIFTKLQQKEIELGLAEKNGQGEEWFKNFSDHINSLEKYAEHAVKSIKKDKSYSPSNPKVKSLLKTYDSVKTVERIRKSIVATPWEKFFKRFAQNKKNIKGASDKVIQRNYYYLQLCFLLLKKEYIEQITKQECRKLSELMFRVPKGWRRMLKTNPNITSILTNNPKKALTRQTISQFLFTFKEFMRFAAREDIIPYSLNEFVDVPQKIEQFKRAPFESDELRKIFNPDTYPNPKSRSNAARFWVPLIGLYQGCRLNEICQLDTADIVVIKKIPCISINDNGKDKSVKNKGSERIIPIHPQLIQLGFLHYVRYCQQNHSHKLFSDKIKLMKSSYKRGVQAWFCRYIDGLGIDDPSKVFHSFRHTFATKAIEKRIPTEYQNALGGWVDRGIGQRIYGHKRDIRVMYQELCKIKYPINRELKKLETEFKNSYVMSCLRP